MHYFDDIEILNDKSYTLMDYHWDNRDKLKMIIN